DTNKPTDSSTTDESDSSDREFNLDTAGLELLPAGAVPGKQEKLPGQFDEHQKTLDRIEENWKKIDRRKWIRRQCADRRKEIRFGGRDRRLAKFDRRRSQRGWKGEWN
ncbi:MAG: hypothetical protein AAF420_08445, partial [Pseudomonadota bacterium]